MKITANGIKVGMVLFLKDKLFRVVKTQHTQPGKGGAYVQAELKCLENSTKLNERFRSSETVERAILEERECTYLYNEGNSFIFMDKESYEQYTLGEDLLSEDEAKLLSENLEVLIAFYEERPISATLPKTIATEVIETEVEIKGQTVTASYKPAIISGGLRISVPPHITEGTKIIVNTEDLSYVGKVK